MAEAIISKEVNKSVKEAISLIARHVQGGSNDSTLLTQALELVNFNRINPQEVFVERLMNLWTSYKDADITMAIVIQDIETWKREVLRDDPENGKILITSMPDVFYPLNGGYYYFNPRSGEMSTEPIQYPETPLWKDFDHVVVKSAYSHAVKLPQTLEKLLKVCAERGVTRQMIKDLLSQFISIYFPYAQQTFEASPSEEKWSAVCSLINFAQLRNQAVVALMRITRS